ncbi:unnamed protein product [Dracunculus medinensis]|uniref:PWWP domain-containing protein n=1 Tax=Dracunculus medinensis TaxID=318479 RepID=A0A3P7PN98_DRAME|nr:unnamed protein product [Dracunculus medinensis]
MEHCNLCDNYYGTSHTGYVWEDFCLPYTSRIGYAWALPPTKDIMKRNSFKAGDLVWAKMKGHPTWPATIMKSSDKLVNIPKGRYSVLFFGTYETGIIKQNDIYDYLKYRSFFSTPKKQKGFMEALEQIQEAYTKLREQKSKFSHQNQGKKRTRSVTCSKLDFKRFTHLSDRRRTRSQSSRSSSPVTFVANFLKDRKECNILGRPNMPGSPCSETLNKSNGNISSSSRRRTRSELSNYSISPVRCASNERKRHDNIPVSGSTLSALVGNDPMLYEATKYFDDVFNDDDGIFEATSRKSSVSKTSDDFKIFFGKRRRSSSGSSSGRSRHASMTADFILGECFNFTAEDDFFRPLTPEIPPPLPPQPRDCRFCGCTCQIISDSYRLVNLCTNKACLEDNGKCDLFNENNSWFDITETSNKNLLFPNKDLSTEDALKARKNHMSNSFLSSESFESNLVGKNALHSKQSYDLRSVNKKSVLQLDPSAIFLHKLVSSPNEANSSVHRALSKDKDNTTAKKSRIQRSNIRPKTYKVEKTPDLREDGKRYCILCNGQVRPQMCGGSRHRWRCVNKSCRKWYGWVREGEEIPKDLGKKGRWKDLPFNIKTRHSPPIYDFLSQAHSSVMNCKKQDISQKNIPKKKCARRELFLTQPICTLEKRCRWWLSEQKLYNDIEIESSKSVLDVAATCFAVARALRTATNEITEEGNADSSALDLLMDTYYSTVGPILSLLINLPFFGSERDFEGLWLCGIPHTPIVIQDS